MQKGLRPMNRRHLFVLTGLLSLVGLAVFVYKIIFLGFPVVPDSRIDLWNVEARVTFRAKNVPVKVSLHIPHNISGFILIDESFMSHRLRPEYGKYARGALRRLVHKEGEWGARALLSCRDQTF